MRVLLTTRGSAGHLLPLVPIARACVRAGHEVVVAAQRQHRANVERAGLPFSPVGDPPEHEWMPLMDRFADLDVEAANALMIGEFFAGIDTRAGLPDLLSTVRAWAPDVIVRESWAFGATIAAELCGVPLARVGLGLMSIEALSIRLAASAVDGVRSEVGLPPDPRGDRLRKARYLSLTPATIEPSTVRVAPHVDRFRIAAPEPVPLLPDWWPGNDDPLVYLTFGSVTAGPHLPYFPALYRSAIDALASLPARVLVTIGEGRDMGELGSLPGNVHVESWFAQDAVASRAAAIVCHGGYGTILGALGHGVPLVVLPLFSIDQWANADAVSRSGAGIALDAERGSRRVLDLPSAATLEGLAGAVRRVLGESTYRQAARRIAGAISEMPPAESAVEVLAAIAGERLE
jgi:UDP:flavonoid glycosyltransferase YjiC (YdhE family)